MYARFGVDGNVGYGSFTVFLSLLCKSDGILATVMKTEMRPRKALIREGERIQEW